MEIVKMTRKEFIIGMIIISAIVIIGSIFHFLTINTTEEIKATKVNEVIHCTTDDNGVVECQS